MAEIYNINCNITLQMAFKALNDSVGPNGLISTLLIFRAYPQIVNLNALLLIII